MASDSQMHAATVFKDQIRRRCEQVVAGSLAPSSPQTSRSRSPRRHHLEKELLTDNAIYKEDFGIVDGNMMRPAKMGKDPFGPPPSMKIPQHMIKTKTTNAEVQVNNKEFRIDMDVTDFAPEELDVKIVGDHMVIRGKHKEHPEINANISREFCRRFTLPEDIIVEDVTVFLAKTGMMSVKVPRKISVEERQSDERKAKVKFQDDKEQKVA